MLFIRIYFFPERYALPSELQCLPFTHAQASDVPNGQGLRKQREYVDAPPACQVCPDNHFAYLHGGFRAVRLRSNSTPHFIMGGATMDAIIVPFLNLIIAALQFYVWCLLISVVLSWLVAFKVINTSNRFVYMVGDFLYRITEPALGRIRRFLPNMGGVDLSPIVLILLIIFVQEVLTGLALKSY
jgi:YggT family protein